MKVLFYGPRNKNYVIVHENKNFENEENSLINGEVDLEELICVLY